MIINLLKEIRQAVVGDYQKVDKLIRRSFEESNYGYHSEAEVISRIRDNFTDDKYLELVALDKEKIVAYILITEVKLGDKRGGVIAPLVVDPDFQHQGLGETMIDFAEKYILNLNQGFICAVGQPEYFGRFGFFSGDLYDIKPVFKGVPSEMFVFKELIPHYLENVTAQPEYVPSFYYAKFEETFYPGKYKRA